MADADTIAAPDSGSGSEAAVSPPRWASAGDWEAYRGTITHLYEERGMSLDHVVQKMRDKHGFLATYAGRGVPPPWLERRRDADFHPQEENVQGPIQEVECK